jgi:hypothetical protein
MPGRWQDGSDVLGGELGAEAEKHGAGGGVEPAADLAARQQAPRAVQAGDEHEQVGDGRINPEGS